MNPHRQHYFEANFHPEQDLGDEHPIGRSLAIVLVIVASLGAMGSYLLATPAPVADPVPTPVRSPVIQVYELPPIAVEDARIEGFRAGYSAAIAAGCKTAILTSPIASR